MQAILPWYNNGKTQFIFIDSQSRIFYKERSAVTLVGSFPGAQWLSWQRRTEFLLFVNNKGEVWETSLFILSTPVRKIERFPAISHIFSNCQHTYSLLVDENGSVWAMGEYSKLILREDTKKDEPVFLESLHNIESVSAGSMHALFLDRDGMVLGVGYNGEGELGEAEGAHISFPVVIKSLPKITKIAAGFHSLFLDADGFVWGCGWNEYGALGLGHDEATITPTKILSLPPIVEISAGESHSTFLDADGSVWACGCNEYFELGFESGETAVLVPQKIPLLPEIVGLQNGINVSLFFPVDGTVWYCGRVAENGDNEVIFPPAVLHIPELLIIPLKGKRTKCSLKS